MGVDIISLNSMHDGQIGNPIHRLGTNLAGNLLAWWWNTHSSHYTSGSPLDPLSGLIALVGNGMAAGRANPHGKFLLVWLGMAMFATVVLSPYDYVPMTRLHSNLLPLALLCGLGVSEVLRRVRVHDGHKYLLVGVTLWVGGYDAPLASESWPACRVFLEPDRPEALPTLGKASSTPIEFASPRGHVRVVAIPPEP